MKITLVWPNIEEKASALYPPLGLGYLASSLKAAGYKPDLIDLTFDSQRNKLPLDSDFYGISCTTAIYKNGLEVAAKVKETNPDVPIVFGGPHPTVLPDVTIKNPLVDIIAVSEAEETIVELANNIERGLPLDDVKGIVFKDKNGTPVKTTPRPPIQNLDVLPFPAQEMFPLKEYFKRRNLRELSIMSARGCPNNCTFCQPTLKMIFGPNLRYRSPKNMVDEIEQMVDTHNLDMVVFSDDTFTMNIPRTMEITDLMIKRGIDVLWRCQTRVTATKEVLTQMKKAGCVGVAFGVESGSQMILNNIQKGTNLDLIKQAFRYCHEVGLLTHSYTMVGNWGETKETVEATKELLKELKPFNMNVSIMTPYPGTHVYDFAKPQNLLLSEEWDNYDHILYKTSGIKLEHMTPEEVTAAKVEIENYFAALSKQYRTKQFMDSIDGTLVKKMIRMNMRSPKRMLRLLSLVTKAMTHIGFTNQWQAVKATKSW